MASLPTSRKASMAPSQAPTERAASMRQHPSRQQTKAASVRSGSIRSMPGPASATPVPAPAPNEEITTIETPVGTVVTTESVQEVGGGAQGGPSEVVVTSASGDANQPSATMVISETSPPSQVQEAKSFPPPQPAQTYSIKSSVKSPKSHPNSTPKTTLGNLYGASDTSSGDWVPPPARPVIHQQTMAYAEPQKAVVEDGWEHSVLGCSQDMGSCCLGTFCPCVLFSRTQYRLNQNPNLDGWSACNGPCMLAALSCCCIPVFGSCIPATFSRNETRKKFALKGDTFTDVLFGFFLPPCSLCQADRETKMRTTLSKSGIEMRQYGNDGVAMQFSSNV